MYHISSNDQNIQKYLAGIKIVEELEEKFHRSCTSLKNLPLLFHSFSRFSQSQNLISLQSTRNKFLKYILLFLQDSVFSAFQARQTHVRAIAVSILIFSRCDKLDRSHIKVMNLRE